MKLAMLLGALGLVASARAFKCYSCRATSAIQGGITITSIDKPCSQFNGNSTFEQTCPKDSFGCVKITDPQDRQNVARGCVREDKSDCREGDPNCYCNLQLCNGSPGSGWPSAALPLLAGMLAALVRGR